METLSVSIGLLAGSLVAGVIATLLARSRLARATALLEERTRQLDGVSDELSSERRAVEDLRHEVTRREGEKAHLEEKVSYLEGTEERLRDTFKSLSHETLKLNNESFLELARRTVESLLKDARGDLKERRGEIEKLVHPLRESLGKYEHHMRDLEKERQKAYGSLEEQLKQLADTQSRLQRETGKLVTALRRPEVRGQWGEMTLRNLVELSGMSEHCDFDVQVQVASEEGVQRPDMLVHLPGSKSIVVDAKVPLDAYLTALESETEDERSTALDSHVRQVRAHIEKLAAKTYWRLFEEAPEFVVMFLPESFFVAAIQRDRSILADGLSKRVVLATPTTLIALLWAVAYGWRQQELARNAQEMGKLGQNLYERLAVLARHFEGVRRGLDQAVQSYNSAVGSLESRVLASARRFKELGVSTTAEIPEAEGVDRSTRPVQAAELTLPGELDFGSNPKEEEPVEDDKVI